MSMTASSHCNVLQRWWPVAILCFVATVSFTNATCSQTVLIFAYQMDLSQWLMNSGVNQITRKYFGLQFTCSLLSHLDCSVWFSLWTSVAYSLQGSLIWQASKPNWPLDLTIYQSALLNNINECHHSTLSNKWELQVCIDCLAAPCKTWGKLSPATEAGSCMREMMWSAMPFCR